MSKHAEYINNALALGVKDCKEVWGACREAGTDVVLANVIGMMLIGKIGIEKAIPMFEEAFKKIGTKEEFEQESDAISEELGLTIDQCESLVAFQWEQDGKMDICAIAAALESGEISIDNLSPA